MNMTVPVQPKSPGVNRRLLFGCALIGVAWWVYPTGESWWQFWIIWLLCGWAGIVLIGAAVIAMLRDYKLRRALALSLNVTDDHGSARQATSAEVMARGMNDANHGDLLGMSDDGDPVFAPENVPYAIFEAPPGVGKTIWWVIGSILHRAMLGYSLVIPDIKMELAYILAPTLRALGFEVWVINPTKRYLKVIGNDEINLYQGVIDAVYADDDRRKDAVRYASDYAAIHVPAKGDEKNPYFTHGSQRTIFTALISSAVINPAHCTPTDAYELIADPDAFLARMNLIINHLESLIPDDPIISTLKTEARNLVHRAAKNEENFASFLEGASQKLLPFVPAGHLGGYGRRATRNVAALRERQVIAFIVSPLGFTREFQSAISLINNNIISACKAKPDGHPVHVVGEEFLNYFFPELTGDLETLRQLKVTASFYIQSYAGLVKKYGREAAAAVESYSDLRVFAGVNSYDRAKFLSDMLAKETLRKQDFSYEAEMTKMGISSRELARPLATPDEILAMGRDRAWVFIRGMRPLCLRTVDYGQVKPWCDWVGNSPISGTKMPARPIITIHYPERKSA